MITPFLGYLGQPQKEITILANAKSKLTGIEVCMYNLAMTYMYVRKPRTIS